MKNLGIVLAVSTLLGLVCPSAFARSGSPGRAGVPAGAGGEPIPIGEVEKAQDIVHGQCSIQAGAADGPTAIPCADVVLILADLKGNEVVRTRTTAKGGFKFAADPSKSYLILPASKGYLVRSPSAPVTSEDEVELRLEQKQ